MNQTKMARLEGTKKKIRAHHPRLCVDQVCCLHGRTQHAMRGFPQHWRGDKDIMERICPCGVGHPDPDDLKVRVDPVNEGVHGCDGCCAPKEKQ